MKTAITAATLFWSALILGAQSDPLCRALPGFKPLNEACEVGKVTWSRVSPISLNYEQAAAYCQALPQLNINFGPWQLPTVEHLQFLQKAHPLAAMGWAMDDFFWSRPEGPDPAYRLVYLLQPLEWATNPHQQAGVLCASGPLDNPNPIQDEWQEVTTMEDGSFSDCATHPKRCTWMETKFKLWWRKYQREEENWRSAIKECDTTSHNGKKGWRLAHWDETRRLTALLAKSELSQSPHFVLTKKQISGYSLFWTEGVADEEDFGLITSLSSGSAGSQPKKWGAKYICVRKKEE